VRQQGRPLPIEEELRVTPSEQIVSGACVTGLRRSESLELIRWTVTSDPSLPFVNDCFREPDLMG
jgi:hypothetical protein